MGKESRVEYLKKSLIRLDFENSSKALDWMISTMNADMGYERHDGSHYYYHLVDATQDLLNHGIQDEATITACILHDSMEDIDGVGFWDIADSFGVEVAIIADLVTKREGVDYKIEENMDRYLDGILDNPKSCLVKTADRKHNFSTLGSSNLKFELKQALETEKFYLPFFKHARKEYPEYSAYFHSAKTTIMPHLLKIKQSAETQKRLKSRIEYLEYRLNTEKEKNRKLENKLMIMKKGE